MLSSLAPLSWSLPRKVQFLSSLLISIMMIPEARPAFVMSPSQSCRQHSMLKLPTQRIENVYTHLYATGGNDWKGDIVSNTVKGKIQGCSIEPVVGSVTEWIVTIDGVEADLGRFSQAVYKKIISDAKQQRFQGFRPGTIPPHLEPTYRAFTMDEVARETILEALQQNNIRPFESARQDMTFENFFIQPSEKKGGSSNKKSKKGSAGTEQESEVVVEKPQWLQFADMKSAIDGGWKPGQSFSFVAKNVKGQKVKDESVTAGATPLGINY